MSIEKHELQTIARAMSALLQETGLSYVLFLGDDEGDQICIEENLWDDGNPRALSNFKGCAKNLFDTIASDGAAGVLEETT